MNLFELFVKIGVDDQASGALSKLSSSLGKGLATAAKIGTAAVSAAASGIAALTKMGVEGYAQYEQLEGGIKTLFNQTQLSWQEYAEAAGGASQELLKEWSALTTGGRKVMVNASNAFKTAGMSANQYMETVTSFSASLIQSLDGDTVKAAQMADMAITDMADNANKMGSDLSTLQTAYAGFAKGQFMLLDNLKLGYQGTKEDMKRLLADAQAISGIKYDISSYADIVDAIHVIQTEMGIAGATAEEASTTIEGSLGMMKAAWENLVVGIADDGADLPLLIDSFVESAGIAAQNLLPRIEQSLVGIGQLIEGLSPIISEALPVLVESVLPSLLTAAVSLVTALVNGVIQTLPALYKALLEGVQIILVEVFGVSEKTAGQFANSVNSFFVKIKDGFLALVKQARTDGTWLNSIWNSLKATGKAFCDFCVALWNVLSTTFTWAVNQINTDGTVLNAIWGYIKTYISAAIEAIKGIITTFAAILQGDWSAAWDSVVSTVLNIGSSLRNAGEQVISSLWDGLKSAWASVASWWDSLTFSDKSANVSVKGGGASVDGSHASGLAYVPFDGYIAELHRGERVLTAKEATRYNNQRPVVNVVQNIYSEAKTAADLMQEALYQQERAVLLGV